MATLTVTQAPAMSTFPTPSAAPSPPRKKRANSRLQAWHNGADRHPGRGPRGNRASGGGGLRKDPPPLIHKVGLAAHIYGIRGVLGTVGWLQDWHEWLYPAGGGPDIVKAYECRPGMGVRIFFPRSFDQTSPRTLPALLTVHGGGFCVGAGRDDDAWNRRVADSQGVLAVALAYSKAPRAPFPAALGDLEALCLAVLADESLPIDRAGRGRVALAGFDAGANLALALGQLAPVRAAGVSAVVAVCGILDLSRPVAAKARARPYKPGLPHPRGAATDVLAASYAAYTWGYVPYGEDLRDPLLSPAFAGWGDGDRDGAAQGLPPHVCLVGAELDFVAHESWRMACRLVQEGGVRRGDGRRARWRVPDPDALGDAAQAVCGREQLAAAKGALEMEEGLCSSDGDDDDDDDDDGLGARKRFGFEVTWPASAARDGGGGEGGSVKWILVPDVMHGFDRPSWRYGGEETIRDAELKTVAYVDAVGKWLRETVWDM